MGVSTVFLPHSTPVSELTVSVPGFCLDNFVTQEKLSSVDSVLLLTDVGLTALKYPSNGVLDSETEYQVIRIDADSRDLSDIISERNVLMCLRTEEPSVVECELVEEFVPDYGQEYMIVSTVKGKQLTPMWAICIELFYRYGVPFYYNSSSVGKYVIHAGKAATGAFKAMKNYKSEMERNYSINLEFHRAPDRKMRTFDF